MLLFKLGHANDILTYLHNFELQLLVLNRLCTQLIAELLYFDLVLIDLSFLYLRFFFKFRLILLKGVDLN